MTLKRCVRIVGGGVFDIDNIDIFLTIGEFVDRGRHRGRGSQGVEDMTKKTS